MYNLDYSFNIKSNIYIKAVNAFDDIWMLQWTESKQRDKRTNATTQRHISEHTKNPCLSAQLFHLNFVLFGKRKKMGHVVIVPRRAVCSPVIEPLGFLPPTFAFSYNSLLHCIAMGDAFVYFVHFVLPYIIDQDQEAFHAGCWWLAKFWLVGNWIKRRCKYISLSNLLNVEEKAELQFAEH